MDDDYDGDGHKEDNLPKKNKLPRKSSSRSAKRQVNKTLLELPEDVLDRSQLVLGDLIRRASFKEQQAKKIEDVAKVFANKSEGHEQGPKTTHVNEECHYSEGHEQGPKTTHVNEQDPNTTHVNEECHYSEGHEQGPKTTHVNEECHYSEGHEQDPNTTHVNEEYHYSEGHEQGPNGGDKIESIQQNCPRLNYHSYMRRPLQTRWSKTDTEYFYQAIRQFGTDFAMIQVLFPNRSRQQVKAKFKNEQRKNPVQIDDALVHRSKDHSHFEKVIQHLQAVAEQKSKNDASDSTAQSQDEADQNEAYPLKLFPILYTQFFLNYLIILIRLPLFITYRKRVKPTHKTSKIRKLLLTRKNFGYRFMMF